MKDIITVLGFLGAGYLFFTWYGKNGQPLQHVASDEATEQMAIAEAGMYNNDPATERSLERPTEVSRSSRQQSDNQQLAVVTPAAGAKSAKTSSSSQIRREVNKLADIAITGATDKRTLVPAGTSMTLLIMGAEKGKQLTEANLRKVIQLLRSTRADASKEDQQFFKYASNSEKWFEGLQQDHNGGYNIGDLLRIYDQYDLRQYDKDVMAIIAGAKIEYSEKYEPKTAAPAMKGDASNEEVRRNHAYAKNRWAEKETANTKADLKFVAAEKKNTSTVSALHREVARLNVGESKSFNDPDDFYAALKELIAVENGFDSWEAFESETGKDKAKRAFRKRSERGGFFGSGGLTITREK